MSRPAPEFSRLVALARLGAEPFCQQIAATADERERLARRFGLETLDRFAAVVTLRRRGGGLILLEAAFDADFAQPCVISLEPVAGTISQAFSLVYGPDDGDRAELELDAEEIVFEPLTGDAIDVGEAVAQELSLALPEFPRDPDAVLEAAAAVEPQQGGPFSALGNLPRPSED